MLRLRSSEVAQRSPKVLADRKVPSQQQKASSCLSSDSSPKLNNRRSPRGSQSDPVNPKKLVGTRIAGLESQLEQAQEELKMLKDQLASAEAAKKEAQQQLESKSTKSKSEGRHEQEKKTIKPKKEAHQKMLKKSAKAVTPESEEVLKEYSHPTYIQESKGTTDGRVHEDVNHDLVETDVFEVQVEKTTVEAKSEFIQPTKEYVLKSNFMTSESLVLELEDSKIDELAVKNDEIMSLKASMDLKDKELEVMSQDNERLKIKLNDATAEVLSARSREEDTTLRLKQLAEELETSKATVVKLTEKLGGAEGAKDTLETEMKKLRVQTEQWRKAADAAATVLAGDVEMNGRRISQRCGSMEKHYYEPSVGGYTGFVGSPGLGGNDSDDDYGNAKKKGSSIRMFGDLWKKKGQK